MGDGLEPTKTLTRRRVMKWAGHLGGWVTMRMEMGVEPTKMVMKGWMVK